jgi:hypothetical protein
MLFEKPKKARPFNLSLVFNIFFVHFPNMQCVFINKVLQGLDDNEKRQSLNSNPWD